MAKKDNRDTIDFGKIIKKLWNRRRTFYIVWGITMVASYLLILGAPRYYTTEAKLAPEMGNDMGGGTLGSIASTFGFDLSSIESNDAISPLLYPDLMDDNGFAASLFSIRVKTADGSVDTDYFTYLKKHQKSAWWSKAMQWVKKLFKKKKPKDEKNYAVEKFDPYNVSEETDGILGSVRAKVRLSVDKKTGVITILVKDQDPLVCKTVADSVVTRLRDFITDYRTNKAKIDADHYEKLASEMLQEYDDLRKKYAAFSDSHSNSVLNAYRTKEDALMNEMELKYTTYTSVSAQLQQAKARVQERTPAFTLLKGAAVPIKVAGPKRVMFAIGMTFLVTFILIFIIIKKDIKEYLSIVEDDDPKEEKQKTGKKVE